MENSPLLRLFFDVKAKPVAAHKPAAVPLHWDARVKAGLDRDVRLGVVERVPVNTRLLGFPGCSLCQNQNIKAAPAEL